MDEFRPKQTNPYSSQPQPVKQQVKFRSPEPRPAAYHSAATNPARTPIINHSSARPIEAGQSQVASTTPKPEPTPQHHAQPKVAAPAPTQAPATQPAPDNFPSLLDDQPHLFDAQTPNAPPEAVTVTYNPPAPVPPPQQTMDAVLKPKKNKKPFPKVLILIPVGLLLLASLTGGGYFVHKKQLAKFESQLNEAKQQTANLKSAKFGSTDGQGLSLAGLGAEQPEGEVAGATDEASGEQTNAYIGQNGIQGETLLFGVFVDLNKTGPISEVWVNYGGSPSNLGSQTKKTTEGLSEQKEGIVQLVAEVDVSEFEAGSSYLYKISVKAKDGEVYETGLAVITVPEAQKQEGATPDPSQSGL